LENRYDFPNRIVDRKGNYLVPEPKVDKNSIQPSITKEEVEKILASDKLDARDKLLVILPYSSSMRISEWSELTYEDIDFENSMVKVRVKGGHISEKTIEMAMPYLKTYLAETGIKSGRLFQTTSKYKQLKGRNSFESRFTYNIQPIAREITGNAKLILTPHVFRRGFARMVQENKIPDSMGMLLGGWQDLRTFRKYGNSLTIQDASKMLKGTVKLNIGLPTLNTNNLKYRL
jgi:integrase